MSCCAGSAAASHTPWIAPHDPEATNAAIKFAPGFWAKFSSDPAVRASYVPGYLLGTDNLGRDTLSRLLWGGRVSLTVGVVSTAMGLFLGVILGMLAGYYPKLDNPIMRFMDLLFTFPGVLLAMLIIGMLGLQHLQCHPGNQHLVSTQLRPYGPGQGAARLNRRTISWRSGHWAPPISASSSSMCSKMPCR